MAKFLVLFYFVFLTFSSLAQDIKIDYYQMYKGGKQYVKPIKYILFTNKNEHVINPDGKIIFYIDSQRFIYNPKEHITFVFTDERLKKIKFQTIDELITEEFEIYKLRETEIFKESQLKIAPALAHHIFKIILVVNVNEFESLGYEVYWQFSIM